MYAGAPIRMNTSARTDAPASFFQAARQAAAFKYFKACVRVRYKEESI